MTMALRAPRGCGRRHRWLVFGVALTISLALVVLSVEGGFLHHLLRWAGASPRRRGVDAWDSSFAAGSPAARCAEDWSELEGLAACLMRSESLPHMAVGIRSAWDTPVVFVASPPGMVAEVVLDAINASFKVPLTVTDDNPAFSPFSPASAVTRRELGGVEGAGRWWNVAWSFARPLRSLDGDAVAAVGRRRVHWKHIRIESGAIHVEADVSVLASASAIRKAREGVRMIVVAPLTREGALSAWESLVGWVAREAHCKRGNALPFRLRAALHALVLPALEDPWVRGVLRVEGDERPLRVRELGRAAAAMHGMLGRSIRGSRTTCVSQDWPCRMPQGSHYTPPHPALVRVAEWAGVPRAAEQTPLVFTLAMAWHGIVQAESAGAGDARSDGDVLLVDSAVDQLRQPAFHPLLCALLTRAVRLESPSTALRCSAVRSETAGLATDPSSVVRVGIPRQSEQLRDPAALPPSVIGEVRSGIVWETLSWQEACEVAGGVYSPASSLLPPQRTHMQDHVVVDTKVAKVAVVFLELNPDDGKRILGLAQFTAAVTSLRRWGGVLGASADVFLLHTAPSLSEDVQELLTGLRVRPLRVEPIVPVKDKDEIFVIKLHALLLQGYERIVVLDSDMIITMPLSRWVFLPPWQQLLPFIDSVNASLSPPPARAGSQHGPEKPRTEDDVRWTRADACSERMVWCALTFWLTEADLHTGCESGRDAESTPAESTPSVSSVTAAWENGEVFNGGAWSSGPSLERFATGRDEVLAVAQTWVRVLKRYPFTGVQFGGAWRGQDGLFQFGPLPAATLRQEHVALAQTWASLHRSMTRGAHLGANDHELALSFSYSFVNSDQGLFFHTLALLEDRGSLMVPPPLPRRVWGDHFVYCHFLGATHPWKAQDASPNECWRLWLPMFHLAMHSIPADNGMRANMLAQVEAAFAVNPTHMRNARWDVYAEGAEGGPDALSMSATWEAALAEDRERVRQHANVALESPFLRGRLLAAAWILRHRRAARGGYTAAARGVESELEASLTPTTASDAARASARVLGRDPAKWQVLEALVERWAWEVVES
jgi:hypothetical protein